jgi:8-oxo-dGTP pyrophosphatase MutT (NUDIX family)
LEAGETALQAALRETCEESGLGKDDYILFDKVKIQYVL